MRSPHMRVCDEQQFPSERDPGVVRSDWRDTEMCVVYLITRGGDKTRRKMKRPKRSTAILERGKEWIRIDRFGLRYVCAHT